MRVVGSLTTVMLATAGAMLVKSATGATACKGHFCVCTVNIGSDDEPLATQNCPDWMFDTTGGVSATMPCNVTGTTAEPTQYCFTTPREYRTVFNRGNLSCSSNGDGTLAYLALLDMGEAGGREDGTKSYSISYTQGLEEPGETILFEYDGKNPPPICSDESPFTDPPTSAPTTSGAPVAGGGVMAVLLLFFTLIPFSISG